MGKDASGVATHIIRKPHPLAVRGELNVAIGVPVEPFIVLSLEFEKVPLKTDDGPMLVKWQELVRAPGQITAPVQTETEKNLQCPEMMTHIGSSFIVISM